MTEVGSHFGVAVCYEGNDVNVVNLVSLLRYVDVDQEVRIWLKQFFSLSYTRKHKEVLDEWKVKE